MTFLGALEPYGVTLETYGGTPKLLLSTQDRTLWQTIVTISLNSTVDGEHAWANQNVIRINYKRPECDDPSGDFAEDPEICPV